MVTSMRRRRLCCFLTTMLALASGTRLIADASASRRLLFPEASNSVESLHPALAGVTLLPKHLVMIAKDKNFLIFTEYPLAPPPALPAPSRFANSKRQKLPLNTGSAWHAIAPLGEQLLVLGGESLTLAYLSSEVSLISSHTLIHDLIRPAPDRGGEAPASEIAELRARFQRVYAQTGGLKLVGMAALPKAWGAKKPTYLLATRLPGFPLVMMSCSEDNPSQCQLTRACQPGSLPGLRPESITGLAVSAKQRLILLGDAQNHRLVALTYHSCLASTLAHTVALPEKLKGLTNLYIDNEETLWLTTEQHDDYHNASLYRWPAGTW